MKTLTLTNIAEAAAALTVSPWASEPMSGVGFGDVQALVERSMR